jgi:xylan 1,4-beta-xylosidase
MADRGSAIQVVVDAAAADGQLAHNWTYIGYDEINYTYVPEGQELLAKFQAFQEQPYYVRVHHLLCTGNCHASYKWGSTNAYLEDENGNPIYDWTFIDLTFDTILRYGCKPFVEIGFMPQDLADTSRYSGIHESWMGPLYRTVGWACPPRDYQRWYELVYALVVHCAERYGPAEAASWYWELWNEPDIFYWRGTPEEFYRLYDYTAAAVKAALPTARIGGPATTNPAPGSAAAAYLDGFLAHCAEGRNALSGELGAPLDFVTFHVKGGGYRADPLHRPQRPPSVRQIVSHVANGHAIISAYPKFRDLECILSEIDPDGWAAGGTWDNANLNFRNTEYYASFVAAAFQHVSDFARRQNWDVRLLSWAFLFVGERCFEGTRAFSTQGIDKAILNLFRMYASLGHRRVRLTSSGAGNPLAYADPWGSAEGADVSGVATLHEDGTLDVLIYSHHDDWHRRGVSTVELEVVRLPAEVQALHVEQRRIDGQHSNAYAEWLRQGRPMYPTPEQRAAIKARESLELAAAPTFVAVESGRALLRLELPTHAVTLCRMRPLGPTTQLP